MYRQEKSKDSEDRTDEHIVAARYASLKFYWAFSTSRTRSICCSSEHKSASWGRKPVVMSDIEKLLRALEPPDLEAAAKAATSLADLHEHASIPSLMNALASPSTRVRNAAAYALGELRAEEALPVLFRIMRDSKTYGDRGSLVYAVMLMDCADYLLDLAWLMSDEHFEVRMKAIIAMKGIQRRVDQSVKDSAIQVLTNELQRQDISEEHRLDVQDALSLISDLEERRGS